MAGEQRRSPIAARFDGVLERLKAVRPSLPKTAGRIADYVLAHPAEVVNQSVTVLAERTHASEGSVVALCQLIGAGGFHQLKVALAGDLARPGQSHSAPPSLEDDVATIAQKVFRSGIQAIDDTQNTMDVAALEQAVRVLREADRVEIFGSGSAGPIAEHAHYRLVRIGINARVSTDSHMQVIAASLASSKAAVLTISHSGSTVESVAATQLAKASGATTIVITNLGKSPILAYADIALTTFVKDAQFHGEAMTSRIAQLAIVDTLVACLALADYSRSSSTLTKTGGVLSSKHVKPSISNL